MRVGQAGRAEQLEGLCEVHLQKGTKDPCTAVTLSMHAGVKIFFGTGCIEQ